MFSKSKNRLSTNVSTARLVMILAVLTMFIGSSLRLIENHFHINPSERFDHGLLHDHRHADSVPGQGSDDGYVITKGPFGSQHSIGSVQKDHHHSHSHFPCFPLAIDPLGGDWISPIVLVARLPAPADVMSDGIVATYFRPPIVA